MSYNVKNEGVSSSRNSMQEIAHMVLFLGNSTEKSSQLFAMCYEAKESWVQRYEETYKAYLSVSYFKGPANNVLLLLLLSFYIL